MLRKNNQPKMELTKLCRKCKLHHPFSAFKSTGKPVSSRDRWPFGYCRDCRLGITDIKRENAKQSSRLPIVADLRFRNVRLTEQQLNSTTGRNFQILKVLRQKAIACDICKRPPIRGRFVVDHNHKTGICRGIICSSCNSGLGFFFDDPKTITSALKYLKFPPLEDLQIPYPRKKIANK